MIERSTDNLELIVPTNAERADAKHQPNGWLYRIAGNFSPTEHVPAEAIFGAWKIDEDGNIVGEFTKNPNYDPLRFPPPAIPEEE